MHKLSEIVFAVFVLVGCSGASAGAVHPFLLSQALHYALDHSPAIISARSSISGAEAQKLGAVAAFLPSLSLVDEPEIFKPVAASGSSVIGGVVVPSGHGFDANVRTANLSETLFAGGKGVANMRASLQALQSANLGLTAALDTVFAQLLTDFGAVSIDQTTVREEQRVVTLDQDLVALMRLRMQGRVASEIDVAQAEQQLLQAQLQVSQAREQWAADLEKVCSDIGLPRQAFDDMAVDSWVPAAPSDIMGSPPMDEDPAIRSALAAVLSAQEKVMAARADYYPKVYLLAQYNYLGVDPSSMRRAWRNTHANNYSFGLEVSVPILPFFNVLSEVDAARAGLESARGSYQGVLVTVANTATDATERLREAHDALKIATHSVNLANHNVKLLQDRYAAHAASRKDVDSARVSAVQAEQYLAAAQVTLRLAEWERFRAFNGNDFPTALLRAVLLHSDGSH